MDQCPYTKRLIASRAQLGRTWASLMPMVPLIGAADDRLLQFPLESTESAARNEYTARSICPTRVNFRESHYEFLQSSVGYTIGRSDGL